MHIAAGCRLWQAGMFQRGMQLAFLGVAPAAVLAAVCWRTGEPRLAIYAMFDNVVAWPAKTQLVSAPSMEQPAI